MKVFFKSCLCLALCLMFGFMCIGYAEVSESLRVKGTASVEIPSGLFITDVKVDSTSYVDKQSFEFYEYTTTLDSFINRSNNSAGVVTYKITVLNNTKLTYSYRTIYYQTNLSDFNGNSSIAKTPNRSKISVECSLENASAEDKIVLPGEELEFTVKYTVGNRLSANTDWRTLVNFQFGINVDGEIEALEVVEEKFLDILNTTSTYKQLVDVLDNKFDGTQEWTSNYIGNVVGSSSEDSVAVNTLFAGQLQITVGAQKKDATVLIKHENIDGDTTTGDDYVAENKQNGGIFRGYGCEMTLYLTVDPLNRSGQYVPVYVVAFTCDRDENGNLGDWYRIGNTYKGEANVVSYNGGNGTGSFVTDNWRADRGTYQLIEGYSYNIDGVSYQIGSYSYNVAEDVNIETVLEARDNRAIETFKTLLDDARKIIENQDYAGVGIVQVEDVYERLTKYYTVDENGNHTVRSDLTIVQLCPPITDLYRVVSEALIRMEALSKEMQAALQE